MLTIAVMIGKMKLAGSASAFATDAIRATIRASGPLGLARAALNRSAITPLMRFSCQNSHGARAKPRPVGGVGDTPLAVISWLPGSSYFVPRV